MDSGEKKEITKCSKKMDEIENCASYATQREKAKARKMRFLANLSEEQKELKRAKDREYFRRRMENKKRKTIVEMSDVERRKQRELWRENSKKYRQKRKMNKNDNTNTETNKEAKTCGAKLTTILDKNEINNDSLLKESTATEEIIMNKIRREEGPSSSQVDEIEVEIQVKQEVNDDPLSLDQIKAEPLDDSEDIDLEPSEKTRPSDNTTDDGEPSSKIVEVSIKNEYDEALMIEENEVRIDVKKEKERVSVESDSC